MVEYWEERKHFKYYKFVEKWIKKISPGDSIIDVGSADTQIVLAGNFKKRIVIDKSGLYKELPNVEYFYGDFLKWKPTLVADLVLCLQVLEHQGDDEVIDFTKKLFKIGKNIIISIPYKWEKGRLKSHKQDPINMKKLETWTGRKPDKYKFIKEKGSKRLIALYYNN
jgi:hypothetical protein